jgi:hypothetical protein
MTGAPTIREAVAVFDDPGKLGNAACRLQSHGIDRFSAVRERLEKGLALYDPAQRPTSASAATSRWRTARVTILSALAMIRRRCASCGGRHRHSPRSRPWRPFHIRRVGNFGGG